MNPATSASGTLIQKIQRQAPSSLNSPPSVGPTTDEMPHTDARYPWVFARSSSV